MTNLSIFAIICIEHYQTGQANANPLRTKWLVFVL
nr:MAG TPA: hypothetical protein [Caudoviricetes sp.]